MNFSVNYLMSGPAHLPYLVVSLDSLMNHLPNGVKVNVFAYPESYDTVLRMSEDSRLIFNPFQYPPFYRGKNGQFLNKLWLMQRIESDFALYLDADTLVAGSIHSFFDQADEFEFIGTQFCDWVSNTGVIKNRVGRLLGREGVDQSAVKQVLTREYPSLNGGVFACSPKSEALKVWFDWSMKVKDIFICDETALHAVMGKYLWFGDHKKFGVFTGGYENCSPKYKPHGMPDEDIRIWHFHGDCNVRLRKSKKGVALWKPEFDRCLKDNIGGMQEWIDSIDNRFLTELRKNTAV